MMTSFMTPEERAMVAADETASAEGAARLLAALIPALDAASGAENIPASVHNELRNQVATLLSVCRGFAQKFERAL
jgi:hypothetical protein